MGARGGMALLLSLAVLVIVVSGVAAGLAAVRGARQAAWNGEVDSRLLAGLHQGERLAMAWIDAGGGASVLPPAGGAISLVDDRFVLAAGDGRLVVAAYDGLAGVPPGQAALRTALPGPFARLPLPAHGGPDAVETCDVPDGLLRFPRPFAATGRVHAEAGVDAATLAAEPIEAGDPAPSLVEAVSFASDGRINVCTAPAPLLRAAYTALGLGGGVDEALRRRQRGETPTVPAGRGTGLRLVAGSDCWQMLITVSWRGVRRSWWVVMAGAPHNVRIVERHAAGD
jgi:hypothetical protein